MTHESIKLNDQVSVRLTLAGANILNKQALDLLVVCPEQVRAYIKTNHNPGEWYTSELWALMNDFGQHCTFGSEPPFTEFKKA